MNRFLTCACLLVTTASWSLMAQDTPIARGRKLLGEQKWKEAEAVLMEETQKNAGNGQAWFWLGLARYQGGAYEPALTALVKADELGTFPGFTRYAIARTYVRQGHTDKAFEWLNLAVAARFTNLSQLDGEEAFASVRSDPRMASVREAIQRNITPAEFDERYRQLDFWVGEWDVVDANGTLQGTNTITKDLGGAVLIERWTNAFGISGMSINFFDPGTGKFKQQWVSQAGYNTAYEGGLVNGSMVMIGTNATIDGAVSKNRMTFTPNADGTVTQFIEAYNDSTGMWSQSFLGTYRKKSQDQ